MNELRSWLLALAQETMEREGAADSAHDFDHLGRVMALADLLQKRESGDLPTIWAAVALHDIGQERERLHGGDHAIIGAGMSADLLTGTLFPQPTIPAVQDAIREHRITGGVKPRSIEARILYDADKIDCLGAIGIGRLFCVTGRYNQKVYSRLPEDMAAPLDPLEVRQLRRLPDYSPSIEFSLLFGNLPDRMMTAAGRQLAQERYEYMVGFFARLEKEVAGEL